MRNDKAIINKREQGNSIFPYNSFNVHIWSNDHNPPHFHVESEGWNIAFTIDDGKFLALKGQGKDMKVYNYIVKNVRNWLLQPCAIASKYTNQENALIIWEQLHDDEL